MSVSPKDVDHIARLARLCLEADEAEHMTGDLNAILEHVDALAAADREEPTEAGEAAEGEAPTREPASLPADPLSRQPEAFAPEWQDGFFVVPRLAALDEP